MIVNTSMSIFNQYTDPFTKNVVFKKHLIENVFWDSTKIVKQNDGYDKNNEISVYVPKNKNDLSNYVNSKYYNGQGWTIKNGDYIVRGNVTESEISGIKDLSQYEVFTIKSFSDKNYGSSNMHHFEIKGD